MVVYISKYFIHRLNFCVKDHRLQRGIIISNHGFPQDVIKLCRICVFIGEFVYISNSGKINELSALTKKLVI